MKEILFKGKRVDNGEWVYGYYVEAEKLDKSGTEYFIIEKSADGSSYKVDSETVGEFTGLTDKNGKRIFEHDILRLTCEADDLKWSAVVKFGNPSGGYNWGFQLFKICGDGVDTDILLWVEIDDAHAEVIGNIYDNPELLRDLITRGDDR